MVHIQDYPFQCFHFNTCENDVVKKKYIWYHETSSTTGNTHCHPGVVLKSEEVLHSKPQAGEIEYFWKRHTFCLPKNRQQQDLNEYQKNCWFSHFLWLPSFSALGPERTVQHAFMPRPISLICLTVQKRVLMTICLCRSDIWIIIRLRMLIRWLCSM